MGVSVYLCLANFLFWLTEGPWSTGILLCSEHCNIKIWVLYVTVNIEWKKKQFTYLLCIIIRFCLLSAGWMLWISTSLCSQHFLYTLYSLSLSSPWYCPSTWFLAFPFFFSHQFLLLISFCMLFGLLIICPKYSHFLFLMIFINLRLVFIILNTAFIRFVFFPWYSQHLSICPHFKASILLVKVFVMVHVSAP